MDHHCHARNCHVPVPRAMLMCKKHWFMVPREIRNLVWMYYQPGQEEGRATPSRTWHDAADRAIAHVFQKEKEQYEKSRQRAEEAPRLPGL